MIFFGHSALDVLAVLLSTPSPEGACLIINYLNKLRDMNLQTILNERISFLKEQISLDNKPAVNGTFQIQLDTLREADHDKIGILVLQKQKQIEDCNDREKLRVLYNELEALEWLQRQVNRIKHPLLRNVGL